MLHQLSLETNQRNDFVDITSQINEKIKDSGIKEGTCLIYNPHTTCGITINEGFDPDVMKDMNNFLKSKIPESGNYKHMEGNSDSHIKSSLIGTSEQLIISESKIFLGTRQKVVFCEFDGPRRRRIFIKISV